MTMVHLGVIHDGHHGFQAAFGNIEDTAHVILDVVARYEIRRYAVAVAAIVACEALPFVEFETSYSHDTILTIHKKPTIAIYSRATRI